MKRQGHLFERVADFQSLCAAARRAARGKLERPKVAEFMMELEPRALRLERELLAGVWRPSPLQTFVIADPKPRRISAAPFADRVVHHALCAAMEPTLERYAVHDAFACRPGKGVRAAIRRAQAHTRRHAWFLLLDVRHFFETLPHATVRRAVRRRIKDRRFLDLLDLIVSSGAPGCPPGVGLPIGSLTSQHLGNLVLGEVDHHVKEVLRVPGYCRYMDDMLLFAPDGPTTHRWEAAVGALLHERMGLALKDQATRRGPVSAGVPFLGFRISPGLIRMDGRRRRRLHRHLDALDTAVADATLTQDEAARRAAGVLGWAAHADTRALLVARARGRAPP